MWILISFLGMLASDVPWGKLKGVLFMWAPILVIIVVVILFLGSAIKIVREYLSLIHI